MGLQKGPPCEILSENPENFSLFFKLSVKDEPANVYAVIMYESLLCEVSIHALLNHQFLIKVSDDFSAVVI